MDPNEKSKIIAVSSNEYRARVFLEKLRVEGLRIVKEDDHIRVWPSKLVTNELRIKIRCFKPILLAVLALEEAIEESISFERSGYVYILQAGSFFKIGKAKNPRERIRTLTIQLPFEARLVHVIECDDHHKAEKGLHQMYKDFRRNGEWFELSESDVATLKSISRLSVL